MSSGFLYAVSSSGVTGAGTNSDQVADYLQRLKQLPLTLPVLLGFGISNRAGFSMTCTYPEWAIVGSAYIRRIMQSQNLAAVTADFVKSLRG